jgi:hypothetical protein
MAKKPHTFQGVIDSAAAMCGSQKALAEHLGMPPTHLSNARSGLRPIPKEKLAVLACLVDMDPARLWELQEVANLPRRNPFLQAASAVLSAFLCVILSVAGNDANAIAIGANSEAAGRIGNTHCRTIASRLWGKLVRFASSFALGFPTLKAC